MQNIKIISCLTLFLFIGCKKYSEQEKELIKDNVIHAVYDINEMEVKVAAKHENQDYSNVDEIIQNAKYRGFVTAIKEVGDKMANELNKRTPNYSRLEKLVKKYNSYKNIEEEWFKK